MTHSTDTGERLGRDGLRFERRFAAPPERVWKALVTPEGLGAWLGDAVTLEPRAGGALVIRFNEEDRMNGTILEFEPQRRLVLAWREDSNGTASGHATREDDESIVTFELAPAGDGGTAFAFTHRYIRPGDPMIGFGAGWHSHLDALGAYLAGGESPDRTALYERLRPIYEGLLATKGPLAT
jgi:uncharacterized protein YndB with AHSA1/START domain